MCVIFKENSCVKMLLPAARRDRATLKIKSKRPPRAHAFTMPPAGRFGPLELIDLGRSTAFLKKIQKSPCIFGTALLK